MIQYFIPTLVCILFEVNQTIYVFCNPWFLICVLFKGFLRYTQVRTEVNIVQDDISLFINAGFIQQIIPQGDIQTSLQRFAVLICIFTAGDICRFSF